MGSVRPKILFDHQIFSDQTVGGVSRYFAMLMAHLGLMALGETRLGLRVSGNQYLRAVPGLAYSRFPGVGASPVAKRMLRMVNGPYSRQLIARGDYDILHPTYYDPYFLDHLGSRPYVLTVYDLIHDLFPDQYGKDSYFRSWMNLTTRHATAIIAISASTKKDLVRLYGIDPTKVSVVHLGATEFPSGVLDLLPGLPDRFVLFVGGRRGYKNFDILLGALPPLLSRDRSLHLVCAGGGAFTREERVAFAAAGMTGRVHQICVDDARLGGLYTRALALIYPSRYEGFGMPVLEAFHCGCPVIAADVSSIPEIGGNAALYVDPLDPGSIAASMERVMSDRELRATLVLQGKVRAKEFTWQRTAEATAAVYRSAMQIG